MRLPCLLVIALLLPACSLKTGSDYKPTYPGAKRIDIAKVEFDDGDTFSLGDEHIRVLGIDTPEVPHPEMGIHEGQPYGEAAAESTRTWMMNAEIVEYVPDGRGLYGRLLAHIFVDRELLAVRLIRHGLAYETVTHYGDNGFPDLAQDIIDASLIGPKPGFEQPYKWKRRQRKKRENANQEN